MKNPFKRKRRRKSTSAGVGLTTTAVVTAKRPVGFNWVQKQIDNAVRTRLTVMPLGQQIVRMSIIDPPVFLVHQNTDDLLTQARTGCLGDSTKQIVEGANPYVVAPPAGWAAGDLVATITPRVFGGILRVSGDLDRVRKHGIQLSLEYGPFAGATRRRVMIYPETDRFDLMILAVSENRGLGQIAGVTPFRVGIERAANQNLVFEDYMAPGEAFPALPIPAFGGILTSSTRMLVNMRLESLNLRDIGSAGKA